MAKYTPGKSKRQKEKGLLAICHTDQGLLFLIQGELLTTDKKTSQSRKRGKGNWVGKYLPFR